MTLDEGKGTPRFLKSRGNQVEPASTLAERINMNHDHPTYRGSARVQRCIAHPSR